MTRPDRVDHNYYIRQLKDWKLSAPIEQMNPSGMATYAQMYGWALAWAHAPFGDRIALAAYLGGSGKFDQAIADFAEAYADQNELDYAALQAAVKDGRAQTTSDIWAVPARHCGKARRWFRGKEFVVIFHAIGNGGGTLGPAARARAL